MELHKKTTGEFIKYLERHGYPSDRIVPEWGTENCVIDIAVIADDYTTPVAIFEVKGKKTPQSVKMGISQLKRMRNMLDMTVSHSLVFACDTDPFFEVVDVSDMVYNDDGNNDIKHILESTPEAPHFLSYKNIKAGVTAKMVLQEQKKKQTRIDRLKPICWFVVPPVSIILIILDACGVYSFTSERLLFIGGTVVLFLLPFFSEITLKGFALKRNKEREKQLTHIVEAQE